MEVDDRFNRGLGKAKGLQKYIAQAMPNIPGILKAGPCPLQDEMPGEYQRAGLCPAHQEKGIRQGGQPDPGEKSAFRHLRPRLPRSLRNRMHPREVDRPLAIRQLKRFASDQEMELVKSGELALPEEKIPPPDAKKVADHRRRPGGLTAAGDLADRGFAVTVYEARNAAGGMLRWGIPRYRLPKNILDHEIELIRRKGVNIRL